MELIYKLVRSSRRSGGDWVKGVEGEIVILAHCVFHFIRVHDNLVQHPSNNISIIGGES